MNPPTLSTLAADLTASLADLEQREAALAAAAEQLSQDRAVAAAFRDGGHHMRRQILALIDCQLEALRHGGAPALVLTTLTQQIHDLTP